MRQNKRKTVSEINLTPLLDVLFSILFIVMMAGAQSEEGIKEDYGQQVNMLEKENAELSEQLDRSENQMSSYDKYKAEAIILTVNNTVRGDNHYLLIYKGLEKKEIGNIQLGIDKSENVKNRINGIITELVKLSDNQPVYIVFYCDKKHIYTAEYNAVEEEFGRLQATYKEVFFKVMEVKDK